MSFVRGAHQFGARFRQAHGQPLLFAQGPVDHADEGGEQQHRAGGEQRLTFARAARTPLLAEGFEHGHGCTWRLRMRPGSPSMRGAVW